MPKRTYEVGGTRKRYRTVTGYDRRKGGMTKYARKPRMAMTAAVKKAIAGEIKGADVNLSLTPVLDTTNTNGAAFVLNGLTRGDAAYQRVGRKVKGKSLRIRVSATHSSLPQAVTLSRFGNQLRMVVVLDKAPNGGAAIPTFDTVFGQVDTNGAATTQFNDPVNFIQQERFSVLRDCIVSMNPQVNPAGGTVNETADFYQIDEFIDLKDLETTYNQSNNETYDAMEKNCILCYFRCQINNAVQVVAIDPDSFARYRYHE